MTDRSRETVLQSALATHRVQVSILDNASYCGRWYENEPQTARGQFHLIGDGECWAVGAQMSTPAHLRQGDLIVFPHGSAHVLSGQAPGSQDAASESRFTTLLCGELDFGDAARNLVLGALPHCFVVRADDGGEGFRALAGLLIATARGGGLGQQLIMDKLADSLFAMAVLAYAERATDRRGLIAALSDARLSKALAALHAQPGLDWTVDGLARVAGMSRTSFALAFADALGTGPIQYLTAWRVSEAKRLLADRRLSVAAVAEQLGYQSEAAFRRAFKRVEGVGPGQLRKTPRDGHAEG